MKRSCSQVCRAAEVADMFMTPDSNFDDNETSDSEDEDCIETDTSYKSEEDAEFDDLDYEMEVEGEESDKEVSMQQATATQSSRKYRIKPYLHSKYGFIWSRNAPDSGDGRSQFKYVATPKGQALNVTTSLEAWSLLFCDEIMNIIVTHTNEEITRTVAKITANGGRVQSSQKTVDLVELKAVIGLLYFAGMQKVSTTSTRNLWSPYGMSIFRLTMSVSRFLFLLLSLRFDNKNTRAERRASDCLANIREIWNKFIANCMANYELHTNCTIDEQFLPFRGKCPFKRFTPKKPDKYGMKIIALNDATTHYMYNAIPYLGVVKDPIETVPFYYIRTLSEPIHHSGRNITCDEWFTSVPIVEKMKKDYNLTMVGTLRKSEREIPEEFKKLPTGTNVQFGYHDEKTLVSYNSKDTKIVLLLSSLHVNGAIDETTGNPEIVDFYNRTKSRTNSFDQKCRNYTTARKTRRWPMRYFYGMLDQANINSLILYTLCENNLKMKHADFILDLSLALVKPLLSRRLTYSSLRTSLRVQIEALVNFKDTQTRQEDKNLPDLMANNRMKKPKRCSLCPTSIDRKTFAKCLRCDWAMCKEHTAKVCCNCCVEMIK